MQTVTYNNKTRFTFALNNGEEYVVDVAAATSNDSEDVANSFSRINALLGENGALHNAYYTDDYDETSTTNTAVASLTKISSIDVTTIENRVEYTGE